MPACWRGGIDRNGVRPPGVGRYLTSALFAADTPAILGATLLIGTCFVLLNALADALTYLVDPRTR